MRSKQLFSISLLSIAALTGACSRHKVAAAPTPSTTSAADRAAIEAADRENARLHADAGDANADRDAATRWRAAAGDNAASTAPILSGFDRSEITAEGTGPLDQKAAALA